MASKIDHCVDSAYAQIIHHNWQPTTKDIVSRYALSDQQVSKVKRRLKEAFAGTGGVWGYHPGEGRFILAPKGNVNDSRAIIAYAADLASNMTEGLQWQIRGTITQGIVTKDSGAKAIKGVRSAARSIANTPKRLEWK